MAAATRCRANSTAATASTRLTPRRRNPARANRQVTAQTPRSARSSARPPMGPGCCGPDRRAPSAARLRTSRPDDRDERDEASRGAGVRMAAVGLFTEPVGALLDRERRGGFSLPQLVPLALASPARTTGPEDRLQVIAAGFVGRYDADRRTCAAPAASFPAAGWRGKPVSPQLGAISARRQGGRRACPA